MNSEIKDDLVDKSKEDLIKIIEKHRNMDTLNKVTVARLLKKIGRLEKELEYVRSNTRI